MVNYLRNLLKLAGGKRDLHPRVAVYYVTLHCNLNCPYCEDFGARRNEAQAAPLSLEEARRILKVIRGRVPRLWLKGGRAAAAAVHR